MKRYENFIGREILKDAFWRKYNELAIKPADEKKVYVLSYYGMGGMGKSCLFDKLKEELKEEFKEDSEKAPKYAEIELAETVDSIGVLRMLVKELSKKYNYEFPLFMLAYNTYAGKIGDRRNISRFENDENPRIGFPMVIDTLVEFLPEGIKKGAAAAKFIAEIMKLKKKYPLESREMQESSAEQLRAKLAHYFTIDMNNNAKQGERPLVVFIDVYENLVNEIRNIGASYSGDKLLRDDDGIFKNVSNVFWVIAGRESLKWSEYDNKWDNDLNQHRLYEFTPEESNLYLELSGVDDEKLRKELYELTNGLPFYLDICQQEFKNIKASGETPGISMFGKDTNELFERFVRDMGSGVKDVFHLLSALGKWNDNLISDVMTGYSDSDYEMIKELSFVTTDDNGNYVMNRTVAEVLIKKCPSGIRKKAGNLLIEKYSDYIKDKNFDSPDFGYALSAYLRGGLLVNYDDRQALCEFYKNNVKTVLYEFISEKFYSMNFSEFGYFLNFATEGGDLLCAYALLMKCYYLFCCNRSDEAVDDIKHAVELTAENTPEGKETRNLIVKIFEGSGNEEKAAEYRNDVLVYAEECFDNGNLTIDQMNEHTAHFEKTKGRQKLIEVYRKIYDSTDHETDSSKWLVFLYNFGNLLHKEGHYALALNCKKIVRDKRRAKDADHPYTLYAEMSYADTLTRTGHIEEAINEYNEAIKKSEAMFGADNEITLVAKSSLGFALMKAKEYDETIKILDGVIAVSKEVLGAEHRETLFAMHNKAVTFYEMGEYENAYNLQKDILGKREKMLGADHIETLASVSLMAIIESQLGGDEEAVKKQLHVIEMYKKVYGENGFETLEAMSYLGVIYQNIDKHREAYGVLNEALGKYGEVFGEYNSLTKHIALGVLTSLVELIKSNKVANKKAAMNKVNMMIKKYKFK